MKHFLKTFVFLLALTVGEVTFSQTSENRLPTKEELELKGKRLNEFFKEDEQKLIELSNELKKGNGKNLSSSEIDLIKYSNETKYVYKSGQPYVIFTTGPEQNCKGAIDVCTNSYNQSVSYTGYGTQEVYGTCLSRKESNSVWYVFTVQTGGSFGFTLSTTKDYDFALYDITSIGCAGVPTATPVRCNYSATYGNTGLTISSPAAATTLPAISYGSGGTPFMPGLSDVTAGQTFALIIDNYSADNTGYSVNFSVGGTSSIFDNVAPTFTGTPSSNCTNTITLTFNEFIDCASIASNGSDFAISGPSAASITAASGLNCTTNGLTKTIVLTYTGATTSGTYIITSQNGNDGNTVKDKCGTNMTVGANTSVNILGTFSISPSSVSICQGSNTTLTATNVTGATYTWSPGSGSSNSYTVTPSSTTTYQVTVNYNGCTKTANATVTLSPKPIASVAPRDTIICPSSTVTLTATGTLNGTACASCAYNWTGGHTASGTTNGSGVTTTSQGAGTYSWTVTSAAGCSSAAAVATVSTNNSSGTACNLYYVTPTGAGTKDGTSIANACDSASLSTLLTNVACGGAVIKMSTGTYWVSNKLTINSNIVIEGGYNSTFTIKTSNMSGGSNSTTILRSRRPDGGSGNNVTLFDVSNNSSNFRLQDLRIEMPGSASAGATNTTTYSQGSGMTNYAIKLGTGCSNYDVVRCYIDAGKGSN